MTQEQAADNAFAKDLSQFKLFEGITQAQLEILQPAFERKSFRRGTVLTKFDTLDPNVFFILRGVVDVRIQHLANHSEETVYQLKEGDTVGEFLIARHGRRTATCTAYSDVESLVAEGQKIATIVQTIPELGMRLYLNLSRILCDRLHDNNMLVRQVLSSGWVV